MPDYKAGCDLLEKSYLCGINNNIALPAANTSFVVICLKSLTFVVSITTYNYAGMLDLGCDLLEKSYLCGINNNAWVRVNFEAIVVICLKSLTFVVSITTNSTCYVVAPCCDLLEKSYLCGINNNLYFCFLAFLIVVICLKSLTFVVSITTTRLGDSAPRRL